MKKNLLLALGLVLVAGCHSARQVPYTGMGEYGFTYDLHNSPSPFVDPSYRPLDLRELTRPIYITTTNRSAAMKMGTPTYIALPLAPVPPTSPTPPPALESNTP